MSKKIIDTPRIGRYLDDEEKLLIESMETAINQPDYAPVSIMTPEYKEMLQQAAKAGLEENSARNLRNKAS